jgi:hypothetical protein
VAVSTYAGLHKPPPRFHSPSPSPTRPPPPRAATAAATRPPPQLTHSGRRRRPRAAARKAELAAPAAGLAERSTRLPRLGSWSSRRGGGSAQLTVEGLHGGSRRRQPWSSPACPPGGARPVGRQHPGARLLARPAELAYSVVGAELVHWAGGALELACSAARWSSHARLSGQRRSIRPHLRSIRWGFAQCG